MPSDYRADSKVADSGRQLKSATEKLSDLKSQ